jgi:hypothetical protein
MSTSNATTVHRPLATDYEELKPLIALCKAGRLFDVQDWIAAGKPIDLVPVDERNGGGPQSPLRVAVEVRFHSLVEVLLKAGARVSPRSVFSPIRSLILDCELDLVKLFVENGTDPREVSMHDVLESWHPAMMSYFIDRGADVETQNPFAYAFIQKVRTALGPFKRLLAIKPALIEQADIALRYHCKHGSLKWVALMLWLGADPCKPGAYEYWDRSGEYEDNYSALELAAINNHFDIFKLKAIPFEAANTALSKSLVHCCTQEGLPMLRRLLKSGVNPNKSENGGSSAIFWCISMISWPDSFADWHKTKLEKRESHRADESIAALEVLAEYGAKWVPYRNVNDERRSLMKVPEHYTIEFVRIMAKYKTCEFEVIKSLLKSPTMKRHLGMEYDKLKPLLAKWEKESTTIAK